MTGGWWEGGRPWELDGWGCGARVVREKGAWRDAIRDECAARSACVPGGRGDGGQCHVGGPHRPGRPLFARAGQSQRAQGTPGSVMHKFG